MFDETRASPQGVLVSQIGYDTGLPMHCVFRGPSEFVCPGDAFDVISNTGATALTGTVGYWGNMWGSHWWIADMSGLKTGTYFLRTSGGSHHVSDQFDVGENLLWERTWEEVAIGQLERRHRLAKKNLGWQDCGGGWQEANSHAATIIGLCDLLQHAERYLAPNDIERIESQIVNGCDYLVLLQECAREHDLPEGSLSHQIFSYESLLIPQDTEQAVAAWLCASELLSQKWGEKASVYRTCARKSSDWLKSATPLSPNGVSKINHGIASETVVPQEWMTRDLILQLWGSLLFDKTVNIKLSPTSVELTTRILDRQIHESDKSPLHGHFRTFSSLATPEKSWVHNAGTGGFGADQSGTFAHYLLPLLDIARSENNDAVAKRCKLAIKEFAYGYFLPACKSNPFCLLPLGDFEDEGLLWFAGLWHGMNAAYCHAAVLALEFARLFEDSAFIPIAVGNLQWIAGLNAGLTDKSLFASHMYSTVLPPGQAVGHSMIYGIGNRFAGSWMTIRGSISNGFCTGDQFMFDVEPLKDNDGPFTYTDEDWITHAGGWTSAISRLRAFDTNKDQAT